MRQHKCECCTDDCDCDRDPCERCSICDETIAEFREQPSEQKGAMDELEKEALEFYERNMGEREYPFDSTVKRHLKDMASFARLKVEQREKQIADELTVMIESRLTGFQMKNLMTYIEKLGSK